MVGPRQARMVTPVAPPGIIDRPRLLSIVDRRPVVVLVGMAGYGKSTLSALRSKPLTMVDSLPDVLYESAAPLNLDLDNLEHLAASPASTRVVDPVLRWAPTNMRVGIATSRPAAATAAPSLEDRSPPRSHHHLSTRVPSKTWPHAAERRRPVSFASKGALTRTPHQ